ncbi:MAG: MFS transporter [Chloroflexi bacterium]|nr:MFS transporter [Chloroflexota bacterium]
MLARIINPIRNFNPQARLFFIVLVGMCFAVDGVYNVLLNLYLLRLGYGTEFIGLVNAVGLLSFASASLPAGILGSRYSTTLLMKVGAAISVVGALLLPQAESLPPGLRESWLVFHYALMLTGFALFFVNGVPYLINVVDTAYKHRAFAIKTAGWSLAGFGGSLIGGVLPGLIAALLATTLANPAPYRLTLTLASVAMALSTLCLLRVRPLSPAIEPTSDELPDESMRGRPSLTSSFIMLIGIMTVIRLFQVAGTATAMVYFNVYMDQHLAVSTAMIGAIAALGRLTGVPTALLTPSLIERWGIVKVVIWGSLLSGIFLLPMALIEHWLAAAIGFIGTLALTSIRYASFVVYILDLVPKSRQPIMAGSGEMAASSSFAVMALGGGLLLTAFTFRDLFLLGSLFALIGTALFWLYVLVSKPKRKLKPAL